MNITEGVNEIILNAYEKCKNSNSEYITPEHLLYAATFNEDISSSIEECGGDVKLLRDNLENYIDNYVTKLDEGEPEESLAFQELLFISSSQVVSSGKHIVDIEHIIAAIFDLEESFAKFYLEEQGISKRDILYSLCHRDREEYFIEEYEEEESNDRLPILTKYTTNLNELVKDSDENILIGREDILGRTIEILCRKTKNNPIHVGEPGVGKTAIALGLARLIQDGKVPEKLKGAEIFSLDIGGILAGTKYRGDFEERMKKILDEISDYDNPIVYIDEIHNIVGAGSLNSGSLDASNLLKPYLLQGKIKFIGATTFEEYKKYFEKDKGLSRRFQVVEVNETSVEETIKILMGLKKSYEKYHNVKYSEEAIRSAVVLSDKYINDRFLPDKAIDIIDEAGAYMNIQNDINKDENNVSEEIVEEIISRVCKIPKKTVESNELESLRNLDKSLRKNIYGQENAIREVSRCIKLSRAGLSDENKPVASMLFVGPTGVGKTEIAKTIAKELGIELVRFDMSEYGEKHAASKLIGAPPGYVGYEEGGLLTDAIRKKPHCVLLLDEIEKAHEDIFNVLLQVMDYATLTDNQGRKADFRNVIIIMTSNAGAKNVGKNLLGFGERKVLDTVIEEEVKKTFTPEFRNRLDNIIVFNNVDKDMALMITKRELDKFKEKLVKKNIDIEFTEKSIFEISEKGVSKEFGAREIIRVINSDIKTLLVEEILFGFLKDGGKCIVDFDENKFLLLNKCNPI
ncbi:ATP-dependent Clp protease ATP-binding subunit ClpA [Clostridium bornimense]|uniref:ATP-dependent Clp protease ATP-binding subunit ClpA n=1 Tax=Clostridium bornimense TaxID=1216932 RepID=W6SEZ3_9CLOT|nr:ATP-dependent Clp protease ATP-binding subunit ClpA [Clostridium bornimense]CDM68270.1 ATP-dependent Clp protease ATP-binding subunit ClpA [Clostridium bornimense]